MLTTTCASWWQDGRVLWKVGNDPRPNDEVSRECYLNQDSSLFFLFEIIFINFIRKLLTAFLLKTFYLKVLKRTGLLLTFCIGTPFLANLFPIILHWEGIYWRETDLLCCSSFLNEIWHDNISPNLQMLMSRILIVSQKEWQHLLICLWNTSCSKVIQITASKIVLKVSTVM